MSTSTVF